MGKVQLFEIRLGDSRVVYSPGEPLAGTVTVRLSGSLQYRGEPAALPCPAVPAGRGATRRGGYPGEGSRAALARGAPWGWCWGAAGFPSPALGTGGSGAAPALLPPLPCGGREGLMGATCWIISSSPSSSYFLLPSHK